MLYTVNAAFWPGLVAIGCHLLLTVLLHLLVPQAPRPSYSSPLFPYVPSLSLLLNAWLCGTLPGRAWVQYAIFLAVVAAIYFVYSAAGSYALQEHSGLAKHRDGAAVVPPSDMVRVLSSAGGGGAPGEPDLVEVAPSGARTPSFVGVAPPAGFGGADGGGNAVGAGGAGESGNGAGNGIEGKRAVELV